jgi:hypothetical protein
LALATARRAPRVARPAAPRAFRAVRRPVRRALAVLEARERAGRRRDELAVFVPVVEVPTPTARAALFAASATSPAAVPTAEPTVLAAAPTPEATVLAAVVAADSTVLTTPPWSVFSAMFGSSLA